jgi:hypothetical protein
MLNPAVKISPVPTPAELRVQAQSPWRLDENGHWRQDTIASSVDRTPLLLEERLAALMRSGLLTAVSRVLVEAGVADNSAFPAPLMLLLVCASRACRSENELCRRLQPGRDSTGLWPWLRARWRDHFGEELGPRAPTRDELRSFRTRVVTGGHLDRMRVDFRDQSLAMVQEMGSLVWRPREDLTDVDVRNLLIGDGTITRRHSEVEEVTFPDGHTEVYGSRAATPGRARVQRRSTDNSKDGKGNLYGLNITHIGTLTYAGYMILALDQVAGAESTVAMDLLDAVLSQLPPARVHAVVYDRAITGWHVDYLLGRYGIPVVGKATASSDKSSGASRQVKDLHHRAEVAGRRAVAEQARRRGMKVRQLGSTERTQRDAAAKMEALAQLESLGQVPGVTIHRSSRGVPDVISSTHDRLGVATHTTSAGACRHALVVDDNCLTVLDASGKKAEQPPVMHAAAERGDDGYTFTASWRISCAAGDFVHTETWTPSTRRGSHGKSEGKDPAADSRRKALSLLRLIPQVDDRWDVISGTRNNSESWNHSYKTTLPNKRASSPDAGQQLLQYLSTAMLYNAEHWERDRRHQRLQAVCA